MSRCRDSATAALPAAVAVFVWTAAIVASSQPRVVSANLLALANDGTIEQFVAKLADEQIPVGVVLLANDVRAAVRVIPNLPDAPVDLETALLRFERSRPKYRVNRKPFGALTILPRGSGWCTPMLRATVPSFAATGPVFEVQYQLYRAWSRDPSAYIPPGLVGGMVEFTRFRSVVAVDLTEPTLEDALDALAQQVPGLGWAIKEVRRPGPASGGTDRFGCNLALFDSRSWADTSQTLFAQ